MTSHIRTQHRILNALFAAAVLLGAVDVAALPSRAEKLTTTAANGFEQYVHAKEARSEQELAGGRVFLWIDTLPEPERSKAYVSLRQGQIIVRRDLLCEAAHCAAIP